MRTASLTALVCLALLFGASFWVYPDLPEVFPTHFGAGGEPDAFSEKSWFSWMTLPLIALAMNALMLGMGRMIATHPKWLNIPDQRRYKELAPEQQRVVAEAIAPSLLWIGSGITLLFLTLQMGTFDVATGGSEGLPWYAFGSIFAFPIASMVAAIVVVVKSGTLVKRLHDTHVKQI